MCKVCYRNAEFGDYCSGFCRLAKKVKIMKWSDKRKTFITSNAFIRDGALYKNHKEIEHYLLIHKLFFGRSMLSTADRTSECSFLHSEFFQGKDDEVLERAKKEASTRKLCIAVKG